MNKILKLNKKDGKYISYDTYKVLMYVYNEIDIMIKIGIITSPEKAFKENHIAIDKELLLAILDKKCITKDEIYELAYNLNVEVKSIYNTNNIKDIPPIDEVVCTDTKEEFTIRIAIDYLKYRLNNFESYSICKL